ncbi:hypothetical protein [Alkalihalobacillus pseudalcaliphilus]|uniref:hypothetical protein n=1 Tax=Alkalihalobacillus pseudalcaliphilus TaxID=79884 RepID=UPI00064DB0A9|nr:hypothetical protein [Alkalihalobacillus pseudalcaliphilus]KMK75883.1 hypothetical protein AB990_11520 [Alkalihalobacillus pseudalcaliphilus]
MSIIDLAYLAFVLSFLISFLITYHIGNEKMLRKGAYFSALLTTGLLNFIVNTFILIIWFLYAFQKDHLLLFGGMTLGICFMLLSQLLLALFLLKTKKSMG